MVKIKNDENNWEKYEDATDYEIDSITEHIILRNNSGKIIGVVNRNSWKEILKK